MDLSLFITSAIIPIFTVVYETLIRKSAIKLRAWYRTKSYTGIKIGRAWRATETYYDTTPATTSEFIIEFTQNGKDLTATCKGISGPDINKEYEMKGSIVGDNITITWEPKSNGYLEDLERGTLSLKLINRGSLVGIGSLYSDITRKFEGSEFTATLSRDK